MANITTSIVVNFSADQSDAEGVLIVEVDDREDGLNGGNTSFIPGDKVAMLVYQTSNVAITKEIATAGSLVSAGSGTRLIEKELITFTGSGKTANTRYPVSGGFSSEWLGLSGGAVTQSGETAITVAPPVENEPVVGVLSVTYTTSFTVRNLNSPVSLQGLTDFPIVVFFNGTAS